MQRKSRVPRYLGFAVLFVIAAAGVAQERLAPVMAGQYTPTFSFGMIGLGTGATARLNVVNLVRTPPPIMTAIAQFPCKVELDVYDGQGKLVKQKTIANLGYGQADFLDVAHSDIATAIRTLRSVPSRRSGPINLTSAVSVRRLRFLTTSRAIPRPF